jgi:hypothetical protein
MEALKLTLINNYLEKIFFIDVLYIAQWLAIKML